MITHEDDVAAHADRLVRLADGRIVADDDRRRRERLGGRPGAPRAERA